MPKEWLPLRDSILLSFSTNMSARITAAPTTYGLVVGDATALAGLVTAYTNALATATTPSTRTKSSVAGKNVSKAQLVATMRILAKRIQANPAVTVQQRVDLGLPIHQTIPSPIPVPATKPLVSVLAFGMLETTLRIVDSVDPSRKAKPAGTDGADVFCYVAASGVIPPSDLTTWRYLGRATRPEFDVNFTDADSGKTASFVARWVNPRNEPGPLSLRIVTPIFGESAEAEAAMKLTPPNEITGEDNHGVTGPTSLAA